MKYKIAGTVVLYNPLPEFFENINSYIHQVDKLYVINNSDKPIAPIFYELKKKNAVFIENKGNLGIGAALNQGVKAATKESFDLLLTMDQDSLAESDMVRKLSEYYLMDSKVGIVSARQSGQKKVLKKNESYEVLTVMTSGNLINLEIINLAGGFREDLFIDYVDHEICLRLVSMGFKIFQASNTVLQHNLGNIKEKRFTFGKFYPLNHSPIRYYYQTRNRLYISKLYNSIFPEFIKNDKRNYIRGLIKMILFESDKISKMKYILKGYVDFKRNKVGKYAYANSEPFKNE